MTNTNCCVCGRKIVLEMSCRCNPKPKKKKTMTKAKRFCKKLEDAEYLFGSGDNVSPDEE